VPYVKAKCAKFDFGWGSAPDPRWELTSPDTQLDLKDLFLRIGRGGRTGGKNKGGEGKKRNGEGRGGKTRGGKEDF